MNTFLPQHEKVYLELMNKRLGLDASKSGNSNLNLILELLGSLEASKIDYNLFFYKLTNLKSFDDLSKIPQLKFHPLTGNRKGEFAISLTGFYRLIITNDGDTFDIAKIEEVSKHYDD